MAFLIPLLVGGFVTFQLTLVMVYGLAILGLNLLTGFNGQFSLGHSAFYGIGAYTTAILMDRWDIPYFCTLPAAGGVCFIVGFLFGLPALRLQGIYLALATFALAIAMPQILKFGPLEPLTGGVQGIVIIKPDPPFGLPIDSDQWLYYFTLAVLLVMFAGAANLVHSRTGRAIMAIRDNPIAAAAMGIDTALYKSLTFGVSALYTGIAGALGAIAVQFVAPDSFTFPAVGIAPRRAGGRRRRLDPGQPHWRPLRAVRAEPRGKDLDGACRRDLRRHPARGHFRHAVGRRRVCPACRRAIGKGAAIVEQPLRTEPRTEVDMRKITRRTILAAAPGALAFAVLPAYAQKKYDTGASDSEIKIGHTNPYSGPASSYGVIGKTETAFFTMLNEQGGINGRKVNFITYDDGYSPPKTVEQVRKLVESDGVLLLFNTLGTPTNTAIHKYLNQKKVPHLLIASGATKWGDPKNFPWSMGWQPNYQSESLIYTAHIKEHHPNAKIAVLYQNDDYGKDYLKGFKDGLGDKAKSMIVAETPYETTDPTVDSQVVSLKSSGADLFFNITIPKFAAQAIKKAAEIDWKPVHILNSVSNSVGGVLKQAGFDNSKGILSTFYLKDPTDPTWKDDAGLKEWVAFMEKYYPDGDKTSVFPVYAYTVAQGLVSVLKRCGDDLTRANIMKQVASIKDLELPMLLPGIKANTSPTDFFPLKQQQMGRFNGKSWELFGPIITGAVHA